MCIKIKGVIKPSVSGMLIENCLHEKKKEDVLEYSIVIDEWNRLYSDKIKGKIRKDIHRDNQLNKILL